jgi:hypothetical protein
MRARYYESASGRFISEDSHRQGVNWFVYAANVPVSFGDHTGNSLDFSNPAVMWEVIAMGGCYLFASLCFIVATVAAADPKNLSQACNLALLGIAATLLGSFCEVTGVLTKFPVKGLEALLGKYAFDINGILSSTSLGEKTEACNAVQELAEHSLMIVAALAGTEFIEGILP